MDRRPVIFYDSGIGGLCYGLSFHSRNPNERLVCIGDRANFPYGTKSKEELIRITGSLTEKIISEFNPKLMALACNAASVSALAELRKRFPGLTIVGTVPAVKPAVLASKKRRIGVLGTGRTISDPCIGELVSEFGPDCSVAGIAAPELVEFIEHRWADAGETEKLSTAKFYIDQFRGKGTDALVLACTHFLFLRDEFKKIAGDEMAVYDSMDGINSRLEFFLDADSGNLRSDCKSGQQAAMAVTGEGTLEPYWEKLAAHFGVVLDRI